MSNLKIISIKAIKRINLRKQWSACEILR